MKAFFRTGARIIALAAVLSACGESDDATAPSLDAVSGAWTGTIDSAATVGSVMMTLQHKANLVSGTIRIPRIRSSTATFTGRIEEGLLIWTASGRCSGGTLAMAGTLSVARGKDQRLSGPVSLTSACPQRRQYDGVLTMTR